MMKKVVSFLLAAVLLLMSMSVVFAAETGKQKLFIIGDGVVAEQPADKFPQQGWGVYMQDVLNDITVENYAQNGFTIATYIESDAWKTVLNNLHQNSFVMIAFGAESVDPAKSENYYSAFLLKYGLEVKKKGATPVFVTPAAVGGTVDNNNRLNALTNSVKAVATLLNAPVADLNGQMRAAFQDYQGTEKDGKIKNSFEAMYLSKTQLAFFEQIDTVSDSAQKAYENKDNIHLSEIGARHAANLVAKALFSTESSIQKYVKNVSDPKQRIPQYFVIKKMNEGNIKGVFMEGMEYNGLPTQVFAYVGLPEGATKDSKVPAMVLTHGAAGHAYKDWVQLWNNKGYAAISFYWREPDSKYDNTLPDGTALKYAPGPRRSEIDNSALQGEKENQFMFHATANISLSYNLINSLPEVNKNETGLTGISWGGIISSRGMGEDTRFKFAMPVYGCGNLNLSKGTIHPDSTWDGKYTFQNTVDAGMPIFWINVSNDIFFSLDATTQSALETNSDVLILLNEGHSQGHGSGQTGNINELFSYADYYLKDGPALPKLSKVKLSGRKASFTVTSDAGIKKARLLYTDTGIVYNNPGKQADTQWQEQELPAKTGNISITIPSSAKGFYVEFTDKNGNRMTTEYVAIP